MVVDPVNSPSLRTRYLTKSLSGGSSTPSKVAAPRQWTATLQKTPTELAPANSSSKSPAASPQASTPSPGAGSTA
ncbi:hypothetical protein EMCG_09537 [[Emmonsia] crescens]|uniref:Uncharacterized protein n=1 Tax=[Emmonsia] crescens TaxID=73230 RepID=A0A0G2J9S0_9EURO|nr:hypothetical protein EMCG_09537 [Emmonsia crescens UAMH 3008]